jgi:hypothetical protein
MKKRIGSLAFLVVIMSLLFSACDEHSHAEDKDMSNRILESEVLAAQQTWGDAIVAIGDAFTKEEDYKAVALKTVDDLYAYDETTVLFKPTKAASMQFRLTKDEAVSYFVEGVVPEDHGFAIQPWNKVRFENAGIFIDDDSAVAMGNYFFTDANTGLEAKVEFTFGYIKDDQGNLLINIHHSSFPYNPGH